MGISKVAAVARDRLLAVELMLNVRIKAAEEWHPNYKKNRKLFKRLLTMEASLEQSMKEYFRGLPTRAIQGLVNWPEVYRQMKPTVAATAKTEDVVVSINTDQWDQEARMLFKASIDHITEGIIVGGMMAEEAMGTDIGFGIGNATVLEAANTRTMELCKGLNETTLNQLRQAITQGLSAGENKEELVSRIEDIIGNPVRAEMIAQTESVRANTIGQLALGNEIGTEFKVWEDGQAGECEECLMVSPKRIPIDEMFSNGTDGAPAHPRCRCGLSLDYANEKEKAALEDGTYDPEADYSGD